MQKCLFLLCLCLVPFVVFSSTTFTSQNPIELPSDDSVPVLDTNGNPLENGSILRASYYIVSADRGAVYLGPSPNSPTRCPNGVFRYSSDDDSIGIPVKFISAFDHLRPGIFENQYINIKFDVPIVEECIPYTIWKVGDYNATLGANLLETGGTIRQKDSSWFKIVKAPSGYNLFYCLISPIICPRCPDPCIALAVGEVNQDGKRRLALVNDRPLSVKFRNAFD